MRHIKHIGMPVLVLSAALAAAGAQAVPVTLAGTTVSFTFDSGLTGLFGVPMVVGDTLSFTPTAFKAQSFNGAGFASASQTFNVTVNANAGYKVSAVTLTEDGDYFNIGNGASVAAGGKLYVRDLESPLAPPTGGKIKVAQPLTAVTSMADFQTTDWTATASANIPAGWGGQDAIVSGVRVTLENILLANSMNISSAAFIEKKFAGLDIVTSPVPEPQSYTMFLVGLGLVGFLGWRKVRAS